MTILEKNSKMFKFNRVFKLYYKKVEAMQKIVRWTHEWHKTRIK